MADFLPVYQGDANLGIATGGQAGVNPKDFETSQKAFDNATAIGSNTLNERLKLLGDTHKTIALLDNEWNTKMFTQKVQDRDAMYKSFMDGNASVKDYLPEDAKVLKGYRTKYDDAYQEWAKNINNRDAAKKFKAAQDDLNDVAARLATRYTTKKETDVAIAGMALSEDKLAQQQNQIKWLNQTDEDGKPSLPSVYQKFKGYDANSFNNQVSLKPSTIKSKDGLYDIPVTSFDYEGTKKKITDNTMEGNTGAISNQYVHTYWEQYTPQQREFLIQQSEEATAAHNAAHPTDLAEPISYDKTTGKLLDDPQDFAAKILLLQNPDTQGKPVGDEFLLKAKTQAETVRHNKAGEDIDWAKLGIEGKKANAQIDLWKSKTNGTTQAKNGALTFAGDLYGQMQKLATNNIITPDKLRQLTKEQLKYLGTYREQTKGDITTKGLEELKLGANDIIELDNGKIKVMRDAKYDKKSSKWIGKWDNTATTTVTNVATNRVNEENQLSGGKEVNNYIGIDSGEDDGENETGGKSSDKPVDLTGDEDASTLVEGQTYNLAGVGKVKWNGTNLVKQK